MDTSTFLGVAGFVVTLLLFAFGVFKWVSGAIGTVRAEADKEHKELHRRVNKIRDEVHDMEVRFGKEFAQISHLNEVEVRLTKSFDKLAGAVDRVSNRIDEVLSRLGSPIP